MSKWAVNVKAKVEEGAEVDEYGGVPSEVGLMDLSRALDIESMAALIDNYNNSFENPLERGQKTGRELQKAHRTLQRNAVMWALGIVAGLGETDITWTDARNRDAIFTAIKIREMMEAGALNCGAAI
jgi:hypothetical protein